MHKVETVQSALGKHITVWWLPKPCNVTHRLVRGELDDMRRAHLSCRIAYATEYHHISRQTCGEKMVRIQTQVSASGYHNPSLSSHGTKLGEAV